MSNIEQNDTKRFRLRLPPVESQIALGFGAALLGLCAVQFQSFTLLHLFLMATLFAAGIWGKRVWAIHLMLATYITLKYFIGKSYLEFENLRLTPEDLLTSLVLTLLAAACFRHLETSRLLHAFYPNAELGKSTLGKKKYEFPSLLGGRWWAIPVAIISAWILLSVVPSEGQLFAQLRLKPLASRLIFLTLFLFFAWFVCRAVIGIFIRWRMDPSQADVQCRSLIAKELWKDVFSIEQRRAKIQSRE